MLGDRNLAAGKNQAEDMHHPGDNLEQVEGMRRPGGNLGLEGIHCPGGNQRADNLDQEAADSHHKAGHKLAVVRIQREVAWADRCVTFVAPGALPWAVGQTSHPFCPFRFCAVSAYRHKPSSRPNQTDS